MHYGHSSSSPHQVVHGKDNRRKKQLVLCTAAESSACAVESMIENDGAEIPSALCMVSLAVLVPPDESEIPRCTRQCQSLISKGK